MPDKKIVVACELWDEEAEQFSEICRRNVRSPRQEVLHMIRERLGKELGECVKSETNTEPERQ